MKRIRQPTPPAQIPLTLMQQIPMNQHQRPRLHLSKRIHLLPSPYLNPTPLPLPPRKPPPLPHPHKPRPPPLLQPNKPPPHTNPPLTPPNEPQTPILPPRRLQRDPKPHRARRVRVQEGAVLVRRHRAADAWLLADEHALQDARVAEAEGARDAGVQG